MQVECYERVDVCGFTEVTIEDVVAEMQRRFDRDYCDESQRPRLLWPVVDAITQMLAAVPDEMVVDGNIKARREVHRRLAVAVARWAQPDVTESPETPVSG